MAAGEDQAQPVVDDRLLLALLNCRIGDLLDHLRMVLDAGEACVPA
jgi:hypothetical protein